MVAFPDLSVISAPFSLGNSSTEGGRPTGGGPAQVVVAPGKSWSAAVTVLVRTNADVLTWRAYLGLLSGRAGLTDVPVADGKRAPWPISAQGLVLHPGRTRPPLHEGSIYEAPAIPPESEIRVRANAAAAAGATTIPLLIGQAGPILAGHLLTAAGFLYLITVAGALAGSVQTITFTPRLRVAVAAGLALEFAHPTCPMRLRTDDAGWLQLQRAQAGEAVTMQYEEVF